jgi:nicotinamidase-related amidase
VTTEPRASSVHARDSSALLVLDAQDAVVARYPTAAPVALTAMARAIGTARSRGILIVYVRLALRVNSAGVSHRNRPMSRLADVAAFAEGASGTDIHQAVRPGPNDLIVTKRRVGAFVGSDLEILLRTAEVEHVVLTGLITRGVVLSTLVQAADLDFGATVLSDACADPDPAIHTALCDEVFPLHADVRTVGEWAQSRPGRSQSADVPGR